MNNENSATAAGTHPPGDVAAQRILQVIQAAHLAETDARGPERRPAFRVTRYVLGGAARLGISPALVGAVLGVRADTVRTRMGVDGLIDAGTFAALAGVTETDIGDWERNGLIHWDRSDHGGVHGYRASELLRALTTDER
jgi:hypothetical protein